MRRRAWAAWATFAVGLALAITAEFTGAEPLRMAAGLLIVAAIVLALSLLPFWRRVGARIPPQPDLFPAVGADQRWCDRCGHATAEKGPCAQCGHQPREREPKAAAVKKSKKDGRGKAGAKATRKQAQGKGGAKAKSAKGRKQAGASGTDNGATSKAR